VFVKATDVAEAIDGNDLAFVVQRGAVADLLGEGAFALALPCRAQTRAGSRRRQAGVLDRAKQHLADAQTELAGRETDRKRADEERAQALSNGHSNSQPMSPFRFLE